MAYCVPLGIPHSVFLEWDEGDQDKALAYERDRRTRCSGCGTHKDEWESNKFAYVGWNEQCPGCEALEMERDNLPEDHRGYHITLVPQEVAAERMAAEVTSE